jgi:hypothetical protein
MVVAALVMLAVAAVVVAGVWSGSETADVRTDARTGDGPTTGMPDSLAAYFNVDGRTPSSFPETKLGLAFLALDEPLARAVDALGSPTSTEPDIFGTARTWDLPGGARLMVSAWDDTHTINGVHASVPPESPARLGVFGRVVIGQSPLRQVVAAWGEGFSAATSPFDDYVVSYVECVGPYPVVVKFDQAAATDTEFAPVPASPLWDEPITSVLIAYADEPAGSAGCSG